MTGPLARTAGRLDAGFDPILALPEQSILGYLFQPIRQVPLAMIAGSLPTVVVAWFVFYWPFKRLVAGYHAGAARRLRRESLRLARAREQEVRT